MSASQAKAFRQLAQNRLFEGIESNLLKEIAPDVQTVRLDPGEVLFREGDPGDSLYLVGKGSVRISKSGRGGRYDCTPGQYFGYRNLLFESESKPRPGGNDDANWYRGRPNRDRWLGQLSLFISAFGRELYSDAQQSNSSPWRCRH